MAKKLGLQYQQHINQIIYTAAAYKNKELIYHILDNEKYNVDDELLGLFHNCLFF